MTSPTAASTPAFPTWTFEVPADILAKGLQLAIFGQDPTSGDWMYWDGAAYTTLTASDDGMDTTLLLDATPTAPKTSVEIVLPAATSVTSGVVVMFVGGSAGISVTQGIPSSPTPTTNPDDLFSLFEFTYEASKPLLDIDISNIDQVGVTYTVESTSAPFPLQTVGSTVSQADLFARFAARFPSGTPFHDCVAFGEGPGGPLRLLAPQDVLQAITPPAVPDFLQPTGVPGTSDPFAQSTYFYQVTETSPTGETAPSPAVFGGFLRSNAGAPTASGIHVGWQTGGSPTAYVPTNPSATGLAIYRAAAAAALPSQGAPATPASGYGLLTATSIADWNGQTGHVYFDKATTVGTQTPPASSLGFSGLATWFDGPLLTFLERYASAPFALYQSNQNNGANGTLWTGSVMDVTPSTGDAITSLTYIDDSGTTTAIPTAWTWGDGTQTYKALQLVGNAYDASDLTKTALAGANGLTAGEYQGAVVTIYAPYFTGNTGETAITMPGGTTYTLPEAPPWLQNAANGPSHMVFGCAGVFATPADPDAVAQQATYPVLATNALTNLQNVIVSALNRGVATGYGDALAPQQYTTLYGFSDAPAPTTGALAAGAYTYAVSGVLTDGTETALSWPQTITLNKPGGVTLAWLPQPTALYQQVNVYRRTGTGAYEIVGAVANTAGALATGFTDDGHTTPPSVAGPYPFYPSWADPTATGFVASNLFSAFLHQNLSADPTDGISLNGLVYGYPFDDQGDFSTNINYGAALPTGITFTLSPLS